jgi:hypothetical protein
MLNNVLCSITSFIFSLKNLKTLSLFFSIKRSYIALCQPVPQLSALSSQSSVMDGGGFGRGRGSRWQPPVGWPEPLPGGRGGGRLSNHPGVADSRVGWQGPPGDGVGHPDSGFLTRNQLDSHLRGLNYIPNTLGRVRRDGGFTNLGRRCGTVPCAVLRASCIEWSASSALRLALFSRTSSQLRPKSVLVVVGRL